MLYISVSQLGVPRNLRVLSAGDEGSVRNLGKYLLNNNIFYLNYDLNIEKLQILYGVLQNVQAPAKVPRVKEIGKHCIYIIFFILVIIITTT
jgi:hypothetical protein